MNETQNINSVPGIVPSLSQVLSQVLFTDVGMEKL